MAPLEAAEGLRGLGHAQQRARELRWRTPVSFALRMPMGMPPYYWLPLLAPPIGAMVLRLRDDARAAPSTKANPKPASVRWWAGTMLLWGLVFCLATTVLPNWVMPVRQPPIEPRVLP
jgi:hypothetical protein